jgi:hypothetical protein
MSRLNVDQIYSRTGTSIPELDIPMALVYLSANQSVTDATDTLVDFDSVSLDTHDWFDTGTHRYTPQIAGYYMITWRVAVNGTTVVQYYSRLRKNGGTVFQGDRLLGISGTTTAGIGTAVSSWILLNGSTDYVDVTGFVDATSGTQFYGSNSGVGSYFQAHLIRRT